MVDFEALLLVAQVRGNSRSPRSPLDLLLVEPCFRLFCQVSRKRDQTSCRVETDRRSDERLNELVLELGLEESERR